MTEPSDPGGQPYPVDEVLTFEQELGKVLLEWSWEGTLHYEEILEKVAAAYGYADSVPSLARSLSSCRLPAAT